MKSKIGLLFISLLMTACGGSDTSPEVPVDPAAPPVGMPDNRGVVVMARASISVEMDNTIACRFYNLLDKLVQPKAFAANPSVQNVNVVLAGNTTMSMSNVAFIVPTMSNAVLDFGNLSVSALSTNDLKKCGPGSNQKCGVTLFRMYTTGTGGAGMWNSADSYGMPITATGPFSGTVGLNQAGAVILQTRTIPNNRNTVVLADFTPSPSYNVTADFTDAGAGSYSTTLNLEFALAP